MSIILTLASETEGGTWRGNWSASTSYAALDCVQKQGKTYAALQASLNKDPASNSTYWQEATIVFGPKPLPKVRCS